MSFYIFWGSLRLILCLLYEVFIPHLGLNLTKLQDAGFFGSVSSISDVKQLFDIVVEPEFLAWEHFYFFRSVQK